MTPVPIGSIRRMVKGKGSLSVGSDFDRNVSDPRAVVESQTNELRGECGPTRSACTIGRYIDRAWIPDCFYRRDPICLSPEIF